MKKAAECVNTLRPSFLKRSPQRRSHVDLSRFSWRRLFRFRVRRGPGTIGGGEGTKVVPPSVTHSVITLLLTQSQRPTISSAAGGTSPSPSPTSGVPATSTPSTGSTTGPRPSSSPSVSVPPQVSRGAKYLQSSTMGKVPPHRRRRAPTRKRGARSVRALLVRVLPPTQTPGLYHRG
jgi:hypothetical protein